MSNYPSTGFPLKQTLLTALPVHVALRNRMGSLGLLASSSRKPGTLRAYSEAVECFCSWVENNDATAKYPQEVESTLVQYVTFLFDDNPRRGSRQGAINALCGIEFFDARLYRTLLLGRHDLEGWHRLVPG